MPRKAITAPDGQAKYPPRVLFKSGIPPLTPGAGHAGRENKLACIVAWGLAEDSIILRNLQIFSASELVLYVVALEKNCVSALCRLSNRILKKA